MEVVEDKPLVLNKYVKRNIKRWKHRIYKRCKTLDEFRTMMGIQVTKGGFSHWLTGRRIPPPEVYVEIERKLEEMGV